MSQPLWMSIEPRSEETRLGLQVPGWGAALRARLPLVPAQPRALQSLLEAIVAWYGRPLCAVLDADAADVRRHGERWGRLLGEVDSAQITVEWAAKPIVSRDRFLGRMGDFRSSCRLTARAATGVGPR